jgi:hypothetical protein
MYDPTIGRWISEDPIGFKGGDPNLYRYVGNAPTNAVDPTGLREFTLEFVYHFTTIELTPEIKDEVSRIFQDAVSRFGHPDNTLTIKWTPEPDRTKYDACDFGFIGTRFTRNGARAGIREHELLKNAIGQSGAGSFKGSFNPTKCDDAAKGTPHTRAIAIATTIAHELGLHGIGGKSDHFHQTGYVDATGGEQMGKSFSDEAAKLIIARLDMDDGDGYWDSKE